MYFVLKLYISLTYKLITNIMKMKSLNINTATRSQLEIAFIMDEKLCDYLGGFEKASTIETEQLRGFITNYIIENDECI